MGRHSAHLISFVFFMFAHFLLDANVKSKCSELKSSQLNFDGGHLILEGPLSFENEWGSIQAEKGMLQKGAGKKTSFSQLYLDGGVVLLLKREEGRLNSQRAAFDKNLGVAIFETPQDAPEEWVYYHTAMKGNNGYGDNLLIQAKVMVARLKNENDTAGKERISGKCRFEAENDVRITLGDRFTAKGAKAYFEGQEAALIGNVEVSLGDKGFITTEGTFILEWSPESKIKRLVCPDASQFSQTRDEALGWKVTCPGRAVFDQDLHCLYLSGGNVGASTDVRPLVFVNEEEKINSDTAQIFLETDTPSFAISKIVLIGNVRLIRGQGALEQYILANRVVYYLQDQSAHFFGKGSERVLLYDKINNLQVSAPEIKVVKDKKTGKECFQGVGDVRFHFAEKEFEQIRKRFQIEKSRL